MHNYYDDDHYTNTEKIYKRNDFIKANCKDNGRGKDIYSYICSLPVCDLVIETCEFLQADYDAFDDLEKYLNNRTFDANDHGSSSDEFHNGITMVGHVTTPLIFAISQR
jgi:hypothetical protein